MSENSKIEWCDHTFNPWEGCQKVGPGCDHCYAEARNARFGGGTAVNWGPGAPRRRTSTANRKKPTDWNVRWFFECNVCNWRGDRPMNVNGVPVCPRSECASFLLTRARPRVFCSSLADVFDNEVPLEWFVELLDLIRLTPNLDWLLLSKRIGRAKTALAEALSHVNVHQRGKDLFEWLRRWAHGEPPDNVWLGATIVNQAEANRDIPKLLEVPARIRFLSMEPLLELVDLDPFLWTDMNEVGVSHAHVAPRLHWVIVGGESGPLARPMHPWGPLLIRNQCAWSRTPFLFKQWGEWLPVDSDEESFAIAEDGSNREFDGNFRLVTLDGQKLFRVGKKSSGRLLDGRTHDEFPRGVA